MADKADSLVRQEDFLAPLKRHATERKRGGEKDLVARHYRIISNQPLPEFSSSYAKAYTARDENDAAASLYAFVYEPGAPLRQKNIHALKTYRHPALLHTLADGIAEIGNLSEPRYVTVVEKPQAMPLSDALARRMEPMPESQLIHELIRPFVEILIAFGKMGISHNRIHPGNVYRLGSAIVLGECISEPSGFSQDYIFEPAERMLTSARAKADYAPSADCYALGMLALHLALGFAPFARKNKETLIRNVLAQGAYAALVAPWDLPSGMQDFFRGVFNDGNRDRWDAQTIETWLAGRRFNLIAPATLRETNRGFEFAKEPHFNRRTLAHAISKHWEEARSLLTDNRLARWLAIHTHRQDTAEAVGKLARPGSPMSHSQENEALARIIIALDPTGPLRFRQISSAVEAIGAQLAYAMAAERPDDIRALQHMIESDLPGFWIEQQKTTPDYAALTQKLAKARAHMRMRGLGFGIERCLYDLNPNLPCLSPVLKGMPASSLAELLRALDAVAPQKATTEDLEDAHIAAFIASRLDITNEIKLHGLKSLSHLATHPGLVMLKLLVQAQDKNNDLVLKGLTLWLGARLLPLLNGMHNRLRQRRLQAALLDAGATGKVQALANILLSPDAFEADDRDFKKASADYAALQGHIASLKSTEGLVHIASLKGRGVAQSLAYSVCLTTVYMTLKFYFHL